MIGIYRITSKENSLIYIGKSTNIKNRWSTHLSELKSNSHHNKKLLKDFYLYGIDNFTFEVMEECNLYILDTREKYYISFYSKGELYNSFSNDYFMKDFFGSRPNSKFINLNGTTAKIMKCPTCGYDKYTSGFITNYKCSECALEDDSIFEVEYETLIEDTMLKSKNSKYKLNENYLKY